MPHPSAMPLADLLAACTVERTRRSGPGGQHRNKVETAIVLTHRPSGVQAQAAERRSQAENLAQAVRRLRIALAIEQRTAPENRPSDLWRGRARDGQIAVNSQHDDFPALLSEALDQLAACGWEASSAADRLEVSSSQLVKLVKRAPRALSLLNAQRLELGKSPLK